MSPAGKTRAYLVKTPDGLVIGQSKDAPHNPSPLVNPDPYDVSSLIATMNVTPNPNPTNDVAPAASIRRLDFTAPRDVAANLKEVAPGFAHAVREISMAIKFISIGMHNTAATSKPGGADVSSFSRARARLETFRRTLKDHRMLGNGNELGAMSPKGADIPKTVRSKLDVIEASDHANTEEDLAVLIAYLQGWLDALIKM